MTPTSRDRGGETGTNMGARRRSGVTALLLAAAALSFGVARPAAADDLSSVVARARDQVESGSYAEALKTLQALLQGVKS